jgi:hypothetical protein
MRQVTLEDVGRSCVARLLEQQWPQAADADGEDSVTAMDIDPVLGDEDEDDDDATGGEVGRRLHVSWGVS